MFSIGQYLSQVKSKTETTTPTPSNSVVIVPENSQQSKRDYTQLIRNNETANRNIQSTLDDVKPLRHRNKNISLAKPSQDEIDRTTERTRLALEKILQSKTSTLDTRKNKSNYVRYTSTNVLDDNPTSSRLIKIIDVQQDPMAPAKFKQKKQMERPPSPPAPILHAPSTTKVTKEDQQKWYIPPAISNWKNPNGFTIALDKRLVVDGRDPSSSISDDINQNFINLADALDDEDKKAREEIKLRNTMKQKLLEKENREKEQKLRQLAQKAREERSYVKHEESDEAAQRRIIREERRKRAEKELRTSRMGHEQKSKVLAKSLLDRDISERTQLGLAKATENSIENQFDSRLFTKSTQVTNSEDQVYDNPLFTQQAINSIYKVSASNNDDPEEQLNSFTKEKRFETLNQGPVEFERDSSKHKSEESTEDFGLQKRQKTD